MSDMVLPILRVASSACIGISIGALFYGVAVAPSREPNRLGLRGLKRQKALKTIEGWASVEPFIRWLGLRVGKVLSESQRTKIDNRIMWAGDYMGISPDEFVALSLLAGIAGTIVGTVAGFLMEMPPAATAMAGGIYGFASIYMQIQSAAQLRTLTIARTLPYAVDLMALSMSAGLDFPAAARQVVEKSSSTDDPLVEEFTLLLQTLNLGRTRKDALMEFAQRVPTEAVQEFVNSLVQAEERGNPVAQVLTIQAGVSRNRRSVRAEESAAKTATKLVLPLMMVLMVVFAMLMAPAVMGASEVL